MCVLGAFLKNGCNCDHCSWIFAQQNQCIVGYLYNVLLLFNIENCMTQFKGISTGYTDIIYIFYLE